MEKTYYEILEIGISSTEQDIKSAYFRKIKEYPVEQYPEQFKIIRQAYTTLKDPKRKKEYDVKHLYGDEINDLQEQALAAYSDQDYELAGKYFKRILMIEPDLADIRNKFALSLLYSGQVTKATNQFKKLVDANEENVTYRMNYAKSLEMNHDIQGASLQYKTIFLFDPLNIEAIFELVDLYVGEKDFDRAILTIDQAIQKNQEGPHVFIYLFKRLKVAILSKSSFRIHETLDQVKAYIDQYGFDNEQYQVIRELHSLSLQLFKGKNFEWAAPILQLAITYEQDNDDLQNLLSVCEKQNKVYKEFERVERDAKIKKSMKAILYFYLFGEDMEEEEFEELTSKAFDQLELEAKYDSSDMVLALKRLMIMYPECFACRQKVFEECLDLSTLYKQRFEQLKLLEIDPSICDSVKRLIRYYLTNFETEEIKNKVFDDIFSQFEESKGSDIKKSLDHLERDYPLLYQLNAKFFADFQ